jgi:hypothetical protein
VNTTICYTFMAADSTRRRWERSPVDFSVQIAIYQDAGKVLIPGHITELSQGGMMVYVGMSLHPGDLLEVEFEFPVRRTVQAVVRYRDGYSFGLEFVEPLPSKRTQSDEHHVKGPAFRRLTRALPENEGSEHLPE